MFWQCAVGADALYSHLRGINVVLIPSDAAGFDDPSKHPADDPAGEGSLSSDQLVSAGDNANAMIAPEPIDRNEPQARDDTRTMVLFRHADANLITPLLASISPDDLSGKDDSLVINGVDFWGKDRVGVITQLARQEKAMMFSG